MIKNTVLICLIVVLVSSPMAASREDSLHKAAYNGDIDLVRNILNNNVDPDARDSSGGTALHAAMFFKRISKYLGF